MLVMMNEIIMFGLVFGIVWVSMKKMLVFIVVLILNMVSWKVLKFCLRFFDVLDVIGVLFIGWCCSISF